MARILVNELPMRIRRTLKAYVVYSWAAAGPTCRRLLDGPSVATGPDEAMAAIRGGSCNDGRDCPRVANRNRNGRDNQNDNPRVCAA